MNYYLIDYENTSEAGLAGIENLGDDCVVAIFYSPVVCKLSFEMHKILCHVTAKLEYHEVNTSSKNALDFQLSTYLGYLISQNPGDNFYIISKDNGFMAVSKFWSGKGVKTEQVQTIASAHSDKSEPQPEEEQVAVETAEVPEQPVQEVKEIKKVVVKKPKAKKAEPATEKAESSSNQAEIYKEVLKTIPEKELRNRISGFIAHYKTKLGINNAIVKAYGSEKRGEIYKKIKPLLKDKKGN